MSTSGSPRKISCPSAGSPASPSAPSARLPASPAPPPPRISPPHATRNTSKKRFLDLLPRGGRRQAIGPEELLDHGQDDVDADTVPARDLGPRSFVGEDRHARARCSRRVSDDRDGIRPGIG